MGTEYVQHRDGNIYVGPSRVTIDTVIINWRDNQRTPEQIHESFPTVPLAHIYGAIAYYLERQDEIDAWIHEGEELWRRGWEESRATHSEWLARNREQLDAIGVKPEGEPPRNANEATNGQVEPQEAPEVRTT